jgi:hypothetical protein
MSVREEGLGGEGARRGRGVGSQTALKEAQAVYETGADYKQQIDELQESLVAAEKLAEQVTSPEVHMDAQRSRMCVGEGSVGKDREKGREEGHRGRSSEG